MAYQMIHLEIAYRLLEKYNWITNREDFLLGAIAPDAVHFHDKYKVQLKEHSHLWNCGPKWGITIDSDKWKENVLAFWKEHKEDDNRDFIAGYCVHILTDWMNDIKIWSPFRNANMKDDNVEEIYHIYAEEAIGSDQWLYQNSSNSSKIMELLSKSQTYSITGCVEQEDVERQKKHILTEQYKDKKSFDISEYRYCTKAVILAFMDECVKTLCRNVSCFIGRGETGLLVTQIMKNRDETDEDLYKALIIDDLGINQGMILENMVKEQ